MSSLIRTSITVLFIPIFSIFASTAWSAEKLKVVTSFTLLADIAQNIAGDAATVTSIIRPGTEIHDYQPTPKDIVTAKKANLILWNGLNLESWFERFFNDLEHVPNVIVSEGIEPLHITEGSHANQPNPHAWMSTVNALTYIENIRQALIKVDPGNIRIYNSNAKAYSATIQALGIKFKNALDHIPDSKRYLVTSEGGFSYLAKDLNLREVYLWPINSERQGTAKQVRKVINTIRTHNIPVVFSESTISDKAARRVVAETNAIYGGILYVDSISGPDGKVPTYLDLLRVNTETIVSGFEKALH